MTENSKPPSRLKLCDVRLAVVFLALLIAGCGPSLPSNDEIKGILEEPILSSLSYKGAKLPREAVQLDTLEILQLEPSEVGDEQRIYVAGTLSASLTASGNEIQGMIGNSGDGGMGAIFEMQAFVRGLGNLLKEGEVLQYEYEAVLAGGQDGEFRIVDGQVYEN